MKPFLDAFRMIHLAQEQDMYAEKYMSNGLKPIEAFYSDISNNLVRWAAAGDCVYYETKNYWYRYQVENAGIDEMAGIVWMRRFTMDSAEQMCWFSNEHSITNLGKKWLFDLKDKRVAVE